MDASGTRYRLADFAYNEFPQDFRRYLEKGLLPNHEEEAAAPTGLNGKRKLLILANASRRNKGRPQSKTAKRRLDSQKVVFEYLRTLENESDFHNNGAARMLLWMLDQEKTNILPRTTFSRRRFTLMSERSCHVEEITGGTSLPHTVRREGVLDLESCIATAQRMSLNGIRIPSSRLDDMPRRLRENREEALAESLMTNEATVYGDRGWQRELYELRKAFDSGQYSQFVGGPPGWEVNRRKNLNRRTTPEYERFRALDIQHNCIRRKKAAVDKILVQDEEIRKMDLAVALDRNLDNMQRLDRLRTLDRSIAQYRELLDRQSKRRLSETYLFADDRVAWKRDHPLLMWDQRTAEPIIARVDEFHGPQTLALLDFEPKSSSLSPLTLAQEMYRVAMLGSIFAAPAQSITDALNGLAPGAAEALIPQVPSLQDPRRGGRRDVDQLRVRLLTEEMIRELAVALEQWKFKPTLGELSRKGPEDQSIKA